MQYNTFARCTLALQAVVQTLQLPRHKTLSQSIYYVPRPRCTKWRMQKASRGTTQAQPHWRSTSRSPSQHPAGRDVCPPATTWAAQIHATLRRFASSQTRPRSEPRWKHRRPSPMAQRGARVLKSKRPIDWLRAESVPAPWPDGIGKCTGFIL